MIQPVRIQMKRKKGFNLQEYSKSLNGLECILVSRPSKWGNPFRLMGDMIYVDASHRRKILSPWVLFYQTWGHTEKDVVKLFRDLLMDLNSHKIEPEIYQRFKYMRDRIFDLRGKDLVCWCPLDQPCHADILLELANETI